MSQSVLELEESLEFRDVSLFTKPFESFSEINYRTVQEESIIKLAKAEQMLALDPNSVYGLVRKAEALMFGLSIPNREEGEQELDVLELYDILGRAEELSPDDSEVIITKAYQLVFHSMEE